MVSVSWGTRSRQLRSVSGLLIVVLLASASGMPDRAFPHAAFVGADPRPGARLQTAPQRISLVFTEPVVERLSRVELRSADGRRFPLAHRAASGARVVVIPKQTLPNGAYEVRWHTVSPQDGHALEGRFSFGVRTAAVGQAQELEQSPWARAGWVRVGFRGLLYAALLPLAAGLLIPLILRRHGGEWLAPAALHANGSIDRDDLRLRERRVLTNLGWLAVVAAVGSTVAEAADAAGGLSVFGLRDYLLSSGAGTTRVLVVVAVLLATILVDRRRTGAALFAVLALGGIAASGHASSATPRVPSIVNDWLHLLSGALWLGGIALLTVVFAPTLRHGARPARQAVARHVLPGFGRVALPAFVVVSLTGAFSFLTQVGSLHALVATPYGNVLAVKIALVAVIAVASAVHAFKLRPRLLANAPAPGHAVDRRHWRLVRSEPVLAAGVLVAVALLVSFPLPPRQVGQAGDAVASACDPCPLPEPAADELSVADQAGSHVVAAWMRRNGEQVAGTVRVTGRTGQPTEARFDVLGARQTSCGAGCRHFSMAAGKQIKVAVIEGGRRHVAALPATWRRSSAARAQQILRRAETTMRNLRSVRQIEVVTSGPKSYALTDYTLRTPNRMRFETDRGVESVVIGERQWTRSRDMPWIESSYGSGLPFSLRQWFRWTPFANAARVLESRKEHGRRVTELAVMDSATPVWFRLTVDDRTGRVLSEHMTSRGHFMRTRYQAFNAQVSIRAPQPERGQGPETHHRRAAASTTKSSSVACCQRRASARQRAR